MKDFTVIACQSTEGLNIFIKYLMKLIQFYTKGPYYHIAIYFEGKIYESSLLVNNKKISSGIKENNATSGDLLEYIYELSEEQKIKGRIFLKNNLGKGYNYLSLLFQFIIYPTRKFWKKIGWIPFSSDYLGEKCSEFVDEFIKSMGIDLFPNRSEKSTVPNDFINCKILKKIN